VNLAGKLYNSSDGSLDAFVFYIEKQLRSVANVSAYIIDFIGEENVVWLAASWSLEFVIEASRKAMDLSPSLLSKLWSSESHLLSLSRALVNDISLLQNVIRVHMEGGVLPDLLDQVAECYNSTRFIQKIDFPPFFLEVNDIDEPLSKLASVMLRKSPSFSHQYIHWLSRPSTVISKVTLRPLSYLVDGGSLDLSLHTRRDLVKRIVKSRKSGIDDYEGSTFLYRLLSLLAVGSDCLEFFPPDQTKEYLFDPVLIALLSNAREDYRQGWIDTLLLSLVRRFAEDLEDSEKTQALVECFGKRPVIIIYSSFLIHFMTVIYLTANHDVEGEIKPHLLDPLLEAGIQNRRNVAGVLDLLATLTFLCQKVGPNVGFHDSDPKS
jgi:hypothetical protein